MLCCVIRDGKENMGKFIYFFLFAVFAYNVCFMLHLLSYDGKIFAFLNLSEREKEINKKSYFLSFHIVVFNDENHQLSLFIIMG
jgi:hypothetical protein